MLPLCVKYDVILIVDCIIPLYQFCFVLESSRFCSSTFDKMSRVSLPEMFVYKFVMSREASVKWVGIGVFFDLPISSRVFSVSYVLGRGLAVRFSV
jgi:hypothetical protein